MSSKVFHVVGGGPGGVGAAYAAGKLGVKPIIYEAHGALAVKPCGRGVPLVGDLPFRVPGSVVLNRIRFIKLGVDGRWVFKAGGLIDGVIVDKGGFLEHVIAEAGGEVFYRARYDVRRGLVRVGGEVLEVKGLGVFAGGFPYYEGVKAPVVQYVVGNARDVEEDTIEVMLDTRLLGYYYVFPQGDSFEVGVGGFASFNELQALLDKYMEKDPRLSGAKRVVREGAMISVGGLRLGYVNGLVKVGEAAGYVLPLTGEGIRPSALSGYTAAKALIEGSDPIRALERAPISRAVRVQSSILDWVKTLSLEDRRYILSNITPEAHAEVALGTLRLYRLIRGLKIKPSIALRIMAIVLRG
ncbi:MAG: NAD(P)/FAD-dependent oxidoreductase [Thermoprotei archaeon]|nr:NAD(P)/FAD-dependent oxidoreductase [Thermoprotei archaeon]